MSKEIIAPATAQTNSGEFSIGNRRPKRISADALAGSETVDIEANVDGTYKATGQQLTASVSSLLIVAPGAYRANKSITASACGVYLD